MNDFIKLIINLLISFLICNIFCKIHLKLAKKYAYRQVIRDDIVDTHKTKSGTITCGGISIILATLISFFIFNPTFYNNSSILCVILIFSFYGIIGLVDDLYKIYNHNSKGLSGYVRLFLEVIGILIILFLFGIDKFYFIHIPLSSINIYLGSLSFIFILLVMLGTANAVNFSDGLDGLAAGLMISAISPFLLISLQKNSQELAYLIISLIGSLLAFLRYNFNPAKMFMGDVGSLAIGGFYAVCALVLNVPLLILLSGIVFIIEIMSVILQVGFFKLTNGKRLFKMAPFHHHFEKKGQPEWKVVMIFWMIGFVFSMLAAVVGVL